MKATMKQVLNFNLVNLAEDGELRASTEAIAIGYSLSHRSVIQLLRRYQSQLEVFGQVAFEMRHNQQGSPTEYALLNERQTGLLVSMMRNTAKVVEFKVQLISEFARMAQSLQNRDMTMWERRLRLEAKDMKSKALATVGSHLMIDRKKEKPALDAERFLIESVMQPGLLPN